MKYGRHHVETYNRSNPHDERVLDMQEQVAKLNAMNWQQGANESPSEFKLRVEQAYDSLADPHISADGDRIERFATRNQWIKDHYAQIAGERFLGIQQQPDNDLKVGGQVARRQELETFEANARAGKDPELNAVIDDLTNQQAARQEYLTNHVIGPAQEAKLKELGLDKVEERVSKEDTEVQHRLRALEESRQAFHDRISDMGRTHGQEHELE
ncbi:MAG: hypothetical protein GC165_01185 [Armatimonadetes bacterium]|nr:hypothetical protein [Armatimonadota bacterium]